MALLTTSRSRKIRTDLCNEMALQSWYQNFYTLTKKILTLVSKLWQRCCSSLNGATNRLQDPEFPAGPSHDMMKNSCECLSLDLQNQVLVRLPVKTLLRLRCVCKAWRSLIDSSYFSFEHLATYRDNAEGTFLLTIRNSGIVVHNRHAPEEIIKEFPFPMKTTRGYEFKLLVHIDGVLLILQTFRSNFKQTLVLWNPSIRKYIYLPPCNSPLHSPIGQFSMVAFGLGYADDSSVINANYKAVVVYPIYSDWVFCCDYPIAVEVYSSNSGSRWKKTVSRVSEPLWSHVDSQVFVKGSINWLGHHRSSVSCNKIVSFDVRSEVLRSFMAPKPADYDHGAIHFNGQHLFVLGECLVLLDHFAGRSFLWVMEEFGVSESWSRIHVFNFAMPMMFNLSGDGEFIYGIHQYEIVPYNAMKRQITKVPMKDYTDLPVLYKLSSSLNGPYMESLALGRYLPLNSGEGNSDDWKRH